MNLNDYISGTTAIIREEENRFILVNWNEIMAQGITPCIYSQGKYMGDMIHFKEQITKFTNISNFKILN